jgi:NADH:ubiquinone oxidoreductase subunit 5 (subunit L)/multisubunit Na+/H+ antiporter MnhA subunit
MDDKTVATLAYVILFAPFAAAILITLFTRKSKGLSAFLSVGSVVAGGILSLVLLFDQIAKGPGAPPTILEFEWAAANDGVIGAIVFHIGVQVDFISVLMSTVVGVVGSCIFVYALGYMKGDEGWSRFFAKKAFGPIYTVVSSKYYIDEFYLFLVRFVQQGIANICSLVEQHIIIGIFINGIAGGSKEAGDKLRKMQTGRVSSYVTMALAGVTLLVFFFVVKEIWA